jgi:hypothetical protein
MRTVIINSTHVVSGTNNSRYSYNFPLGNARFDKHQVAVASVAMYYSWFNITSANQNNTLSYKFPTSSGTTTVTLTIPDGFYSVSDLNTYLQSQLIANGHYLVDSEGNFIYYLELQENAVYYAVQLNCYPVPSSLPSGYSNPASMTFPASATTPQLVVPSTNIRDIFGFTEGSYPSTTQSTTYSTYSSYTPQVTPVQSVIMTCSLVNNGLGIPSNVLYSFTPSGTSFGSLIESRPAQYSWIDITPSNFSNFEIQFLSQSFKNLVINDSNIVVTLVVREKPLSDV